MSKLLFYSPLENEINKKIKKEENIKEIKMLLKALWWSIIYVLAFFGLMDVIQNLY